MNFLDIHPGTLLKIPHEHRLYSCIEYVWYDYNNYAEFDVYETVPEENDKVYFVLDFDWYPQHTREYDYGTEITCIRVLNGEKIEWINGNWTIPFIEMSGK
jgi:hypothetical protein